MELNIGERLYYISKGKNHIRFFFLFCYKCLLIGFFENFISLKLFSNMSRVIT